MANILNIAWAVLVIILIILNIIDKNRVNKIADYNNINALILFKIALSLM